MESCIPPDIPVGASSTSGLDSEAEDRLELELCWCIQQLEASLATGKLHEKQAHDLGKHLHSLKSSTAPLVKKRQIMRSVFGDYRAKMAKDEQKLNKTTSSVKFTSTPINKKSIFIKKATANSIQRFEEQTDDSEEQDSSVSAKRPIINRTTIPFQFNFQTCNE